MGARHLNCWLPNTGTPCLTREVCSGLSSVYVLYLSTVLGWVAFAQYRRLSLSHDIAAKRGRRSISWYRLIDIITTQIPLGLSRHDSTRSTCRAHAFWLCRASRTAQLDSLDTTHSTGSIRLARLARHDELDRRDLQLNLVMITVIHLLFNLSYSLIYWSIHLFNLFHLAEQIGICVCKKK